MTGILHLNNVPKLPREDGHGIVPPLRRAIRVFCDTSKGRMIPIEDECYKLLSWCFVKPDQCYLVRVADADPKGRSFVSQTFADGLYKRVCESLESENYQMTTSCDIENYAHRYYPGILEGTDFLYVPDGPRCKTMVAIRSVVRPARVSCNRLQR